MADVRRSHDNSVLLTQGKLCENDIAVISNNEWRVYVVSEDGHQEVQESFVESENYGSIQVTFISDNDIDFNNEHINVNQLTYPYYDGSHHTVYRSTYGTGDEVAFTTTRSKTYGIAVDLTWTEGLKIADVYTNAEIIERTDTKLYVSGLRHDTHIVVKVEKTAE